MAKHNRNMASQQCARIRIIKHRGKKCEVCGYTGYVDMHHKNNNPRDNSDDNLILLCEYHHAEAHGQKKHKWLDPFRKNWQADHVD